MKLTLRNGEFQLHPSTSDEMAALEAIEGRHVTVRESRMTPANHSPVGGHDQRMATQEG